MNLSTAIRQEMNRHNVVRVSNVNSEGFPNARTVDFATGDNENILYFITFNRTNKLNEFRNDNNVFIMIDEDCHSVEEMSSMKVIKGRGKVYNLSETEENDIAFEKLHAKIPWLKPLNGDKNNFVGMKIVLDEISFTDNAKGFGHTETVNY